MHTSESKIYIHFQDMIKKILQSRKYKYSIKTRLFIFLDSTIEIQLFWQNNVVIFIV